MTGNPMEYFSANVDAWGPLEWFDRLAKATHDRSRAVRDKDDIAFETYNNIASSSATRLVIDFEDEIRMALTILRELEKANVAYVDANTALISENKRLQAEVDRKSSMPGDQRYWEGRYRDEAAENERLRKAVEFYADQTNWSDGKFIQDEEPNVVRAIMSTIDSDNGKVARTALASTGGEHHGN